MNRLADFIDRHRGLLTIVIVGLTLIALVGIFRIKFAVDLDFLIDRDSQEFAILNRLNEDFGSESLTCVMVIQGQDVFQAKFITALRRLLEACRRIPGVAGTFSIDDVPVFPTTIPEPLIPRTVDDPNRLDQARRIALTHPMVAGQLVSDDGQTTVVFVALDKQITGISQCVSIVDQIRALSQEVAQEQNLKIQLTGSPPFRVDILRFMRRENLKLFIIPPLIGFIIALLLFRRLSAIVLAGGPPFIGVLLTMGACGWIGTQWTMISMAIPTMVFVVGFTDSVHLVLYIRRKVSQEQCTPRQAALSAVREIGWACALTSLTTAVGFGSLILAGSPAVRDLGFFCALGTVTTFFVVIMLIPIVGATVLGQYAAHHTQSMRADRGIDQLSHVIQSITKHPKPVAIGGIVLTLLLASSVLRLHIDTSYDWFPMQEESVQAYFTYNKAFQGGNLMNFLVEWPDSKEDLPEDVFPALQDMYDLFAKDPQIIHPLSALNILRCAPPEMRKLRQGPSLIRLLPKKLTRRFIRPDHHCAVVIARYDSLHAAEVLKIHARYEKKMETLAQKYPNLKFYVTGESYLSSKMVYTIVYDLALSLSLASLIITAVMLAAFRSWRYGPICLIPNIFPLAVICAFIFLIDKPLNVANVLLFTICLGIAVDDTIHFITRYRHELLTGCTPVEAVQNSFHVVGKAIITTTFIFVFSFAALVSSSLEGYHNFAFLACAGFIAALIGDLFLLPALLIWMGPRERKGLDHGT